MKSVLVGLIGLILLIATGPVCAQDFAVDSFFDVFTELSMTEGPPYPSAPPIRIASSGGGMYLEDIELGFGPGSDPFDNQVVLSMTAEDTGGPVGGDPGQMATLAISTPDGTFNVDSFFDITYQIDFEGQEHAIKKVDLPSGDFAVDSFFDITYQIEFEDGIRETRGVRGTLMPGQSAVKGISGSVLPSSDFAVDSFFDIIFEIDIDEGATFDPGLPLLRIDLEGGHTPEPSSIILLGTGALALLGYVWRRRR